MAALISPVASAMGGGAVPPQVEEMAEQIASSPFTGQYTSNLDTYGNLNIWWTLGIGSYLFIAAAAVKLAAGITLRNWGKGVIPEKSEEAEKSAEV